MSLVGTAIVTGLVVLTGGVCWTLFNQRRIWVGKWKGKSVMIIAQGKSIRFVIDKADIFVGKTWNKEGVFELQFQDVEQGECSGVMMVQNISSSEGQMFKANLILDGEAISLVQIPSSLFKQASLEQAEMIFRAKSTIKQAPVQNVQWDEILNLCRDVRDVAKENKEILNGVEALQAELRQNFDMMDRLHRAMNSYEQLGGCDNNFEDILAQFQQQQNNLLELLKRLHTSVFSMQLTQNMSDNTIIEDVLGHIHAEIEVEKELLSKNQNKTVKASTHQNRSTEEDSMMDKKKKAMVMKTKTQRNL